MYVCWFTIKEYKVHSLYSFTSFSTLFKAKRAIVPRDDVFLRFIYRASYLSVKQSNIIRKRTRINNNYLLDENKFTITKGGQIHIHRKCQILFYEKKFGM